MVIGLVLAFIAGIILIDMSITEPDSTLGSRIFGLVCGLILIAPGLLLLITSIRENKKKDPDTKPSVSQTKKAPVSEDKEEPALKKLLKTLFHPVMPDDDRPENVTEHFVHLFRNHLHSFFENPGIAENSLILNEITQLYYRVLAMQKKRLDRKSITLDYQVSRYNYQFVPTFSSESFFDGKYQIQDIKETIRARKEYRKNGKRLSRIRNQERADYRLINAKSVSPDEYCCPNCGAVSKKNNLIDGCDYCGTKFTVEDLGMKISRFNIRSDARTEYAVYQSYRSNYLFFFILLVVLPLLVFSAYWTIKVSHTLEADLIVRICVGILTIAFATASISFFLWFFFLFAIFPMIQASASFGYWGKRALEKMEARLHKEESIAEKIRQTDPLFSLNGFYSSVINQLAMIHFADTAQEAIGFTETAEADRSIQKAHPSYLDVIDMAVKDIDLVNYQCDESYQRASVKVCLMLLHEKNGKIHKEKEYIDLSLVKSISLKTQEICAPSFLRCPNCLASLSMIETKTCSHCGTSRRLSDYDWAIETYRRK